MLETIKRKLQELKSGDLVPLADFKKAQLLYFNEDCQILTQAQNSFDFEVIEEGEAKAVRIWFDKEEIIPVRKKKPSEWDAAAIAALLQLSEKLGSFPVGSIPGMKYTREGMMKRVLKERRDRSMNAAYQIKWADNIFGEHVLMNERDVVYRITLRDFDKEIGYVDSIDLRTNKLGTTKHLMWAFAQLKENKKLYKSLGKEYPFIEVFLDPMNDYKITWFYPHDLEAAEEKLLKKYFGTGQFFPNDRLKEFLEFIQKAEAFDRILIRPEVRKKVGAAFTKDMLEKLKQSAKPDYSVINATLFPYQKKGVDFAIYREGTIIADEMGLGKTLQAITTAILKKQIFDFKRTLVICPASLKAQWKQEVEKFSTEKAIVVEGKPIERAKIYEESEAYFLIVNYETVLRDGYIINKFPADFIILDEAQRIKNYATKTAQNIKRLKKKHNLVITGTPIENRLIDLYSIVQFVAPEFLTPLWEFSYQHCYFDTNANNKVTGYYNLQGLKERMSEILIRREKRNVIRDLPNLTQLNVPVNMHPAQADYHASFAAGIARILNKKFKTAFDWQNLMNLLTQMRMVCNSTFLIDKETNFSPKLSELRRVLIDKLDLKNSNRKIIIFSEWTRMHFLIGEVLKELDIGFVELSGKVPVKKRARVVKQFEDDDNCKVFLSSEAGGAGLNLQVADTVINFELPWNPAKKNQRIGRIDRLGQTAKHLTVLNFITRNSIEQKIAAGLMLKQNLFEGVLDTDSTTDEVDFSKSGKAQFLQQLEESIEEFENPIPLEDELIEEEKEVTAEPEQVSDELIEPDEALDEPLEQKPSKPRASRQPQTQSAGNAKATSPTNGQATAREQKLQEMETVMNQGMQFLAGLYKMSTGKDMAAGQQKVEIDKETGEVVMRFKIDI